MLVKEYKNIVNFELKENQWRKPVELIYGAKSTIFDEKQIDYYCELYPQIKKSENVYRIEDAGHWVHFEKTN